jgi:hypothetical protein
MGVMNDFWPATVQAADENHAATADAPAARAAYGNSLQPTRQLSRAWAQAVQNAVAHGRADLVERWRLCWRRSASSPDGVASALSPNDDVEWWAMVAHAIRPDPGSTVRGLV